MVQGSQLRIYLVCISRHLEWLLPNGLTANTRHWYEFPGFSLVVVYSSPVNPSCTSICFLLTSFRITTL